MKKLFLIFSILLIFVSFSSAQLIEQPQYWQKFTGYRSLTGVDTIIGTACDTVIMNIHTCYENYFAPKDTSSSVLKTVWCLAMYADAAGDSVDWDVGLSLSYDSLHWNYRGNIGPHAVSGDSVILYGITKDADLLHWLRLIRTGGADNHPVAGSIGEILLIWQLRGPKLGNEVGGRD